MDSEVREVQMRTVRLDPYYPNVIRRTAAGLANGEYEKGSERAVMATLIDMIRYQVKVDESALFPIMHELDPSRPKTWEEAMNARSDISVQSERE